MPEPQMFYSRPVLDAIGEGILYSDLVCDEKLIAKHGNICEFVEAAQELIRLKAISLEERWTPEEGDDFMMTLTDRGRFLRRYKG